MQSLGRMDTSWPSLLTRVLPNTPHFCTVQSVHLEVELQPTAIKLLLGVVAEMARCCSKKKSWVGAPFADSDRVSLIFASLHMSSGGYVEPHSQLVPCTHGPSCVLYSNPHILYRQNKTGEVEHCISLEGFWPLQCLRINPLDLPDSTEPCNSHLPAPDLKFHIFHFQLAKGFYEAHNTCHMLCSGNGLVFPVRPANDVDCVPVVMSQCKWLRSSFYLSKCPMEAWAGFGPLGHC